MEKKIKIYIQHYINDNLKDLPFIARFWDIEVIPTKSSNPINPITYGHFKTEGAYAIPFYKPISKIVILSILNEE